MKVFRAVCFALALVVYCAPVARGEGFALNEWSARGVALAGGMVGRADDASAIAYNAAGITQLPGTHFMGGFALISPSGSITTESGSRKTNTFTKPALWNAPHGYVSHQLSDNAWIGMGSFSRFGLGNSFAGDWAGRYNVYDIGIQTISFVPTLAIKLNDTVSVSVGVEAMNAHMYMGNKVPTYTNKLFDNDMQLEGYGWGYGAHLGLHMRLNDQWSVGLSYKSQMTLNINGDVEFSYQGKSAISASRHLPEAIDCKANTVLQLPDSAALGIAYKPLDNLSFEVGTVWTRWSTYNALNIYMDNGYNSINNKEWRDGWNFNASVEYKPLDWWTLRAGFSFETPVVNERHADFMVPTNGRQTLSVGTGFNWNNWNLDLAYAHLWINPLDYSSTDAKGISPASGISGGNSKDITANIYMVSLSYSF